MNLQLYLGRETEHLLFVQVERFVEVIRPTLHWMMTQKLQNISARMIFAGFWQDFLGELGTHSIRDSLLCVTYCSMKGCVFIEKLWELNIIRRV